MYKKIYLAGPITGLTYEEATNGWRREAFDAFYQVGIQSYSPMRGKKVIDAYMTGEKITPHPYENHPISTMSGILGRDRNDVMSSDLILMNVQGAKSVSIGTTVELGWADAWRKPVVLVTDKENNPHNHLFYNGLATYVCYDLETAIDCAITLLMPDYV